MGASPVSSCPRHAARPPRRRFLAAALVALVGAPAAAATGETPPDDAADWAFDLQAVRAQALFRGAATATWIREGSGSRVVYLFIDPNCPFSHRLYLATRGLAGRDDLELRWVILGVLHPSSLGKAAAILSAPDRLAALHHNETDWDFGEIPGGGIRPLLHPDAEVRAKLAANAALLQRAGLDTFPVMLYRSRDGHAHMVVGLLPPDQIAAVLAAAR